MGLPTDAAGWQQYLDEHFPRGMQFNWLSDSGALVFPSRAMSMLKVISMHGEWPVLCGFDTLQEDYDIRLYPSSWKEIDRHGHFVARLTQSNSTDINAPSAELSSWISDELAAMLAEARPEDEQSLNAMAEHASIHKDA